MANLLGLEFAIRAYLYAKAAHPHEGMENGKQLYQYAVGEQIPENAMTCYDSLKTLIDRYNKLAPLERRVDPGIVDLRDVFAHGRLAGVASSDNFSLMKTKKEKEILAVSFSQELTEAWLIDQVRRTRAESNKVTANPEIQPLSSAPSCPRGGTK